jgi:hypothetical protein
MTNTIYTYFSNVMSCGRVGMQQQLAFYISGWKNPQESLELFLR